MKTGIERLCADSGLRVPLQGQRLAVLGHAASVTGDCRHTLDALMGCGGLQLSAAFGPQHGMRGDKQDNMIETADYRDPIHALPVFSLYGEVRYPTEAMLDAFDVLLVDLQDIGTRIYTYVTTLVYLLQACAKANKSVWILDRPNPAGRPVEGTILEPGWESFVGAAPMIMRHGLTFAELGRWLTASKSLDLELEVVVMSGYRPDAAPGFGWPLLEYAWVNPSPNASSLNMARCYPGTVLFEGTTLSEGRGTTTPLEVVGAPDLDCERIVRHMWRQAPDWLEGCVLRPCWFEPTFHKHAGKLCSALQIHTDCGAYEHQRFRPYRMACLILKSIRQLYPDYTIWRDFPYEYESQRLAVDLLSGGTFLRQWVDDSEARLEDLEERLLADEAVWSEQREPYLLYR
jgi:uncharacterized protein YbbC (DUF1343 family)